MAALVDSGVDSSVEHVVAAELAVPMLCVGKRIKKDRNQLGEQVVTDYFQAAMERLGYPWSDAVAQLYDLDS